MMRRTVCLLLMMALLTGLLPGKVNGAAPETAGKSALLMDIVTGTVLAEQNAHEPLAPASVTKVMTMLLIMEAIDAGTIGWDDPVTASETAAAKGGSQIYLKAGESMSVTEMVKSIAVSSANDCACAMAEHIAGSEEAFVERMNQRAQELGMEHTHFVNCTGLDDGENASGHKTCAYDIALMSRQLMKYHPEITKFTTIWMDTVRDGAFGLSNTNKLIRFYPGATGLKTGFTSGAGYCLSASAQREGLSLIAVVMGCATSQERFTACKQLLDYGFANYTLFSPELPDTQIPVKLGKAKTVSAVAGTETALLIEKARRGGLSVETVLEEGVSAPVSLGQRLGTVTVKAGEQTLAQVPLVAAEAVEKLLWRDLVGIVLRKVCMAATDG